MSKISLQMYTMREHTKTMEDLDKTLGRLSEIGFELLQYSIPANFNVKEVKALFDKYNIKNDSVFCPSLKIEEDSKSVIEQCELFDTKYVRLDSIPRGISSTASGYKMYAHYLNEVTADLKKHGIKVLYHFHAFEFIRLGDTTGIEIFLKESDPEAVQLIPDTHWIQSGGKNPTEFLEAHKDRYDLVHYKDFGLAERDKVLEARPIKFAPIGEGNLDWDSITAVCKANNVKSYAIEQDDCYGRDPFDCVKSSFDFMKSKGI